MKSTPGTSSATPWSMYLLTTWLGLGLGLGLANPNNPHLALALALAIALTRADDECKHEDSDGRDEYLVT